jgi:hypothetical protein
MGSPGGLPVPMMTGQLRRAATGTRTRKLMTASFLYPVLWVSCALTGTVSGGSYLYQPSYCMDDVLHGPAEAYLPQPGDLFLATTDSQIMRIGHKLAGADAPHHSGIVFRRPDGRLAVLEAGPHNLLVITAWDLLPHLESYPPEKVWIRKRRVPLTCEESARLTEFALAQEGKRFAALRTLALITPIRNRGPLRTHVLGKSKGPCRSSYYCAELVMEALVYTGLFDPAKARPSATFPRELFFDHSPNPYLNHTLDLSPCWFPPARWLDCPVPEAGPCLIGGGRPAARKKTRAAPAKEAARVSERGREREPINRTAAQWLSRNSPLLSSAQ